jgi:hypothetical protein
MDTVRVELQAYHANPQPVMPPPAVIPAPIHDGNDRGPIGNACTQAIRAGQVDAIKTLGILPTSEPGLEAVSLSTIKQLDPQLKKAFLITQFQQVMSPVRAY